MHCNYEPLSHLLKKNNKEHVEGYSRRSLKKSALRHFQQRPRLSIDIVDRLYTMENRVIWSVHAIQLSKEENHIDEPLKKNMNTILIKVWVTKYRRLSLNVIYKDYRTKIKREMKSRLLIAVLRLEFKFQIKNFSREDVPISVKLTYSMTLLQSKGVTPLPRIVLALHNVKYNQFSLMAI